MNKSKLNVNRFYASKTRGISRTKELKKIKRHSFARSFAQRSI